MQDLNNNQVDERITTETNFEPIHTEQVKNKACLNENFLKINGQLSILEKDSNEFKLKNNKQSVEKILIQKAVKTTIQILYDKGLFDNNAKADKVLEDFLFVTRRRGDLEKVNDKVQ